MATDFVPGAPELSRRVTAKLGGSESGRIDAHSQEIIWEDEIEWVPRVSLANRYRALLGRLPLRIRVAGATARALLYIAAFNPGLLMFRRRREVALALAADIEPEFRGVAALYWYASMNHSRITQRKRAEWRRSAV